MKRLFPFVILFVLAGCSITPEEPKYVEKPAEELYNAARDSLAKKKYSQAAREFDEVDRQHPYSSWATQAQLMGAYSLYQANKFDEALAGLDRFIQLHPGNESIAYAYYLRALCYYEQIADIRRDQGLTRNALANLREVVRRFPETDYARDAQLKIDLTLDHLGGQEMEIGRFYQKRGLHLAAINRFRKVIEEYQTTAHLPEALHRLTESYLAIGLREEAKKNAAVLGYNFPGSDWYADSYKLLNSSASPRTSSQSVWGQLMDRLF
ncbi:MAG: outer membrane protein assembly factor BamD [Dongiaceae bacterium]